MKLMRGLCLGNQDWNKIAWWLHRAEVMTGDVRVYDEESTNENWMSTNETKCGQNWPRKAEAITDDTCIMNGDRDRRAHENSTT